jgi:hypothetical protein
VAAAAITAGANGAVLAAVATWRRKVRRGKPVWQGPVTLVVMETSRVSLSCGSVSTSPVAIFAKVTRSGKAAASDVSIGEISICCYIDSQIHNIDAHLNAIMLSRSFFPVLNRARSRKPDITKVF